MIHAPIGTGAGGAGAASIGRTAEASHAAIDSLAVVHCALIGAWGV